jgi:hypothetical protein
MSTSRKSIRVIAISGVKAKCLALLEEVNKTKVQLRVTRRAKAIAVGRDSTGSRNGGTELVGLNVRQHRNYWRYSLSGDRNSRH